MPEDADKIAERIKKFVSVVEEETEVGIMGSRYNLISSAAELLYSLGVGKINQLEFDEAWQNLKKIYRSQIDKHKEDYLEEVEKVVLNEKGKITQKTPYSFKQV